MKADEFEKARRDRVLAVNNARREALWQMATLQVAKMTEQDRFMELVEQRYEELRHSVFTDEDILVELYPYTPPVTPTQKGKK